MSDRSYQPPEIWRIELRRVEQVLGIRIDSIKNRLDTERGKTMDDDKITLVITKDDQKWLMFALGLATGIVDGGETDAVIRRLAHLVQAAK